MAADLPAHAQIIKGTYRPVGQPYSADMASLVKACLTRNVDSRPGPHELVRLPAFVAKVKPCRRTPQQRPSSSTAPALCAEP